MLSPLLSTIKLSENTPLGKVESFLFLIHCWEGALGASHQPLTASSSSLPPLPVPSPQLTWSMRATVFLLSGCWVVVGNPGKGSEGKERESFLLPPPCLLWCPSLPFHQSGCALCFLLGRLMIRDGHEDSCTTQARFWVQPVMPMAEGMVPPSFSSQMLLLGGSCPAVLQSG